MTFIADLHTHTVVSHHAFSTLKEMVTQAKKVGLKAIAITDHAPGMEDSPHIWYFQNLLRLPDIVDGILLIKGVEANIMNRAGEIDLDPAFLKRLDWVIASMHSSCIAPMEYDQATNLWLKIAENPLVDMIGHSEQGNYRYDYEKVTKAFAANHKVVEINASSPSVRKGNEENMRNLALACKKNGTKISVNSDAHSVYDLGNHGNVTGMLKEIDFPQELIINSSMQRLKEEFAFHHRNIFDRVGNIE